MHSEEDEQGISEFNKELKRIDRIVFALGEKRYLRFDAAHVRETSVDATTENTEVKTPAVPIDEESKTKINTTSMVMLILGLFAFCFGTGALLLGAIPQVSTQLQSATALVGLGLVSVVLGLWFELNRLRKFVYRNTNDV